MFGFSDRPDTLEEALTKAVANKDIETSNRLLRSIGSPCETLDMVKKIAKDSRVITGSLATHGDGSETVALYAYHSLVTSNDQPQCVRPTDKKP